MPSAEKYVNQAYLSVTESAANTLTFDKLETGISIFEKVGWLIERLDYFIGDNSTNFAADGDYLEYGLSVSDQITNLGLEYQAILDYNRFSRVDLGAAASGFFSIRPVTKDFSSLSGGGFLVPPNPIYAYAKGISLPNAMTVKIRMFYSVVQLKTEEFWELVESRRMIGS